MATKEKSRKGKLRSIHISVADNGYSVRADHQSDKTENDPWMDKPEDQTVHEDSDSLMSKIGALVNEHEGKEDKPKKKADKPAGTNLLKRSAKDDDEDGAY